MLRALKLRTKKAKLDFSEKRGTKEVASEETEEVAREATAEISEVDISESTTKTRRASLLLRMMKDLHTKTTTLQEDSVEVLVGSSEETEAESSVVESTVEANSVENVALASSVVVNIANSVENVALVNSVVVNTVEVNSVENAVEVSSVETEVALPMEIDPGLSTSPVSTEVAVT